MEYSLVDEIPINQFCDITEFIEMLLKKIERSVYFL